MRRRRISRHRDQARRATRTPREVVHIVPLIYPRTIAAKLLSVSVATLLRLEAQGRLRPIKLGSTPSSQTFYARAEIEALIGGDHAD